MDALHANGEVRSKVLFVKNGEIVANGNGAE
jgi:hypothetical protein